MLRIGSAAVAMALLASALLASGCRTGDGGVCDVSEDCRADHSCMSWDALHEAALGRCDGAKCCVSERSRERVIEAQKVQQREQRKQAAIECRQLGERIRVGRNQVKRAIIGSQKEKAAAPDTAEAAAKRIEQLKLSDETLVKLQTDYAKSLRDIAKAMRKMDRGFADNALDEANAGASSWAKLNERRDAIVKELRRYCTR